MKHISEIIKEYMNNMKINNTDRPSMGSPKWDSDMIYKKYILK